MFQFIYKISSKLICPNVNNWNSEGRVSIPVGNRHFFGRIRTKMADIGPLPSFSQSLIKIELMENQYSNVPTGENKKEKTIIHSSIFLRGHYCLCQSRILRK